MGRFRQRRQPSSNKRAGSVPRSVLGIRRLDTEASVCHECRWRNALVSAHVPGARVQNSVSVASGMNMLDAA